MSRKGFTLIELLVVIAIISLLSSVVLASLASARDRARVSRAAADLTQIRNALLLYQSDNVGAYPCFDHDWSDVDEKTWAQRYISWPTNPWGLTYQWEHSQQGLQYSVSIRSPGTSAAIALDKQLDDGAPSTGSLRYSDANNRVEYGFVDQTVPFNDCHI